MPAKVLVAPKDISQEGQGRGDTEDTKNAFQMQTCSRLGKQRDEQHATEHSPVVVRNTP